MCFTWYFLNFKVQAFMSHSYDVLYLVLHFIGNFKLLCHIHLLCLTQCFILLEISSFYVTFTWCAWLGSSFYWKFLAFMSHSYDLLYLVLFKLEVQAFMSHSYDVIYLVLYFIGNFKLLYHIHMMCLTWCFILLEISKFYVTFTWCALLVVSFY